ncbi:hypothetical protein [Candidatus Pantoea formicae]|uniref:hypothetical protein n=1 Tax=Candidatus Pantoea formicae TaxID=2608355 RepID=UPI003ED917A3
MSFLFIKMFGFFACLLASLGAFKYLLKDRNTWIIHGCAIIVGFAAYLLLKHFYFEPSFIQQCADVGGRSSPEGIMMGCH